MVLIGARGLPLRLKVQPLLCHRHFVAFALELHVLRCGVLLDLRISSFCRLVRFSRLRVRLSFLL
ncbi:hypothetical protein, partial [Mesorhizobium sp.]|uniref:hypothetical protein n=1 Tax=Mesorhizobium sp. TaxID=1871066 RepID=UPI0025C50E78